MKCRISCLIVISSLSLIQCSQIQRSPESGYGAGSGPKRVSSTNAPSVSPDRINLTAIQRVQDFEKRMTSQREKEHYSRLLPWFESDTEKIEYLSLKDLPSKEEFARSRSIWQRAQNPSSSTLTMIQNQDIAMGMPQDYVRKSWGEPLSIEVSGDPLFKNEKWKYMRQISTPRGFAQEKRSVFFEGGKVAGWQTE